MDYSDYQHSADRDYERACAEWVEAATPEQIAEALRTGVLRKRPRRGHPGEFDYVLADLDRDPADDTCREEDAADAFANYAPTADWSHIPGAHDRLAPTLAERFGLTAAQAEGIAHWHAGAMKEEVQRETATLLNRIIGLFLLATGDLRIVAHGLAHAARMAASAGFASLRRSADALGCSPEAVRKSADRWCQLLHLPPIEGAKSPEARAKYQQNGLNNHWRNQTCKLPANKPLPPRRPPSVSPPSANSVSAAS